MKISVICIYSFLFSTFHWSLGFIHSIVAAEDAVVTSSYSASISLSETNSTDTGQQNILEPNLIKSDNLEPSGDVHSNSDEISKLDSVKFEKQSEYVFAEAASQNSGIAEVADTGQDIVFTLVDLVGPDLQQRADIPSAITSHNETPNLVLSNLTSKSSLVSSTNNDSATVESKLNYGSDGNNTHETDKLVIVDVPSTQPKDNLTVKDEKNEEMPSFSEWTQKQLEEAEKKKERVNSSTQIHHTNGKHTSNIKKRWKNYASLDCGAKIMGANPEAVSPSAVLTNSRDEYTLNSCTNRIWFIVELCEAIQTKKIEIANFELFSSTPKEFSISISDRFPTKEWQPVGRFVAKDERDIQSFELSPHLFAKYVKFEMHSHYGTEHFCPVSFFHVYGASEFEVLEKEEQTHVPDDDDDDETLDFDDGESPKNLFSSATDAVISIVKKAAEVLGNKGNVSNNTVESQNKSVGKFAPYLNQCVTPSHIVVCNNCSEVFFRNVYELLSCHSSALYRLLSIPVIREAVESVDLCLAYGLDFHKSSGVSLNSFVNYFFSPKVMAALCNSLAVLENKVVRNTSFYVNDTIQTTPSQEFDKSLNIETAEIPAVHEEKERNLDEVQPTKELPSEDIDKTIKPDIPTEISYTSQIKPTKTLSPDDLNYTHSASVEETHEDVKTVNPTESFAAENLASELNATREHAETPETNSIETLESESASESAESLDDHLDNLIKELNGESTIIASTTAPPVPQAQKESVFLRLSNRIKALERNMSLSSQYLEELSRRYKKQVEEMQRLLDKTLITFSEESKKKDDRLEQLEEQLRILVSTIETLNTEKNTWIHTTYWLFLIGITSIGLMLFCRRSPEHNQHALETATETPQIQRRKSIDVIRQESPVKKKRRPSGEVASISGTYQHLLIDETYSINKNCREKKKRKRKPGMCRSNSITTLNEETGDNDERSRRASSSDIITSFAPTTTSSKIWSRQDSAPAQVPMSPESPPIYQNGFQDISIVLEESEHTALEPLSFGLSQLSCPPSIGRTYVVNGDVKLSPAPDMKNATDSKLNSPPSQNGTFETHKKSASIDDTKRDKSPCPSVNKDTQSLKTSFEKIVPKKEKKGGLRRIFKSFNFK